MGRDADPSPSSRAIGHEKVELYLYSPSGPYGLYRASLRVQGCTLTFNGPGSSVGIATGYGLGGPGIESPWGARFSAPVQTGPGAHTASCTIGTGSFPGVKRGRGVTKFANNINEFGWETVAQRRLIARICAIFKTHTGRWAWKAIGNRLLKPCYLSWGHHIRKIRTRKQRTDVGKYSFVNRTIKSWNQLPASLLASFRCKLNTFRKRVKNVVTSKGIEVGIECK